MNNCGGNDPHATGIQGEELAARYLIKHGCTILERNFRGDRYEIDIIARDGDTIVFCEVKTSRSGRFGSSLERVDLDKMRRITLAATEYVIAHDIYGPPLRFDVIGIDMERGEPVIRHIRNAFAAPEDM